ncbi:hypothetical protein CPAR01_09916 [Colletotrichum paranaense]|uniref:Uncharacterized protein n=1 Tax=Colletotrichum paranaense TaxID=1914294 RepID=A0ABQ9SDS2_9PEZI|nr:uncharacterized protein CPAR01_09916 [Colletotrichum paranaense]KAK1533208.1 hypothetical protein CPAR01_09916 [Colletotrichum paranaense]
MCTIHIIKRRDCDVIESTWRQYCPSTPPNRLCQRGQISLITTYLLRGHCDLCLTKMGTYGTLVSVETTLTMTHETMNRKSRSGSLNILRDTGLVTRLSMGLKRMASEARRFYSGLEHGLSSRAKIRWQGVKQWMSRDLELMSQNRTRGL